MSTIKDIKISDIIELEPVSNRLRNVINRAFQNDSMPFGTLQEYIDDQQRCITEFYQLPNVGKKTVKELMELLEKYKSGETAVSEKPCDSVSIDPALADVHILTFISKLGHSVRLENSLKYAIGNGQFPYKKLGELNGKKRHNIEIDLLKVKNLGRRTASEFIELVMNYSGGNNRTLESQKVTNNNPALITAEKRIEEFFENIKGSKYENYTLVDVITNMPGCSKSEEKIIRRIIKLNRNVELITLKNYQIDSLFDLGSILVDDEILAKSLSSILVDFIQFIKRIKNSNNFSAQEYFSRDLDCLNEKEKTILFQRYSKNRKTLKELGGDFDVTRERIRQIEQKAINKYLRINRLDLMLLREYLKGAASASKGVLTLDAAAQLCKSERDRVFFCLSIMANQGNEGLSLDEGFIITPEFTFSKEMLFAEIESRIYKNVTNFRLSENISKEISTEILEYFVASNKRKYKIDKTGNIKVIAKLASERCKLLLEYSGQPLHTREAHRLYRSIFSEDVSEHSLSSTFNRMPEVLIINTGTYALYSQLALDADDIKRLEDVIYNYVETAGEYVSSRIIYEHIHREFPDLKKKEPRLNYYVIHGIAQDDNRYLIRRGFMVGLPHFSDHMPLESEIEEIVEFNGPVSIPDIINLLRNTRGELTNGSVRNILIASDNIYLTSEQRKWDVKNRVFEDDEDVSKLETSIKIAAYHERITLAALCNRVRSVGLEYSLGTILSVIWKLDTFVLKDGYASYSATDEVLDRYMNSEEPISLRSLDYRRYSEEKSIQTDVIDSLLKEFDFNV